MNSLHLFKCALDENTLPFCCVWKIILALETGFVMRDTLDVRSHTQMGTSTMPFNIFNIYQKIPSILPVNSGIHSLAYTLIPTHLMS